MADLSPELVEELKRLPADANPSIFGALSVRASRLLPGSVSELTKAWGSDAPPGAHPEVVQRLVDERLSDPRYSGFLRPQAQQGTQAASGAAQAAGPVEQPDGSLEAVANRYLARHSAGFGLSRIAPGTPAPPPVTPPWVDAQVAAQTAQPIGPLEAFEQRRQAMEAQRASSFGLRPLPKEGK